jgi:hypothetical protein
MSSPLQRLGELGRSIGLHPIRRGLIAAGEVRRVVDSDGLLEGTPPYLSVCGTAASGSYDRDEDVWSMLCDGEDTGGMYEALSRQDYQEGELLRGPRHSHQPR